MGMVTEPVVTVFPTDEPDTMLPILFVVGALLIYTFASGQNLARVIYTLFYGTSGVMGVDFGGAGDDHDQGVIVQAVIEEGPGAQQHQHNVIPGHGV